MIVKYKWGEKDYMEYSESDWKLFKERIVEWQENYINKLLQGYMELLSSSKSAGEKFYLLKERVEKDKKNPGVVVEKSRSKIFVNIINLINFNVITVDDLDGFSDELKQDVSVMLKIMKKQR